MKFSQLMIMASVLTVSAIVHSDDALSHFVTCYRQCNEAFISDLLARGEIDHHQIPFLRHVLENSLQESLHNTSEICVDNEHQLMGDVMCYGAHHDLCLDDSVKLIHLPPFSNDRSLAPEGLLDLIAERTLSSKCIDAFIL